ncbi:MAG: type II secretion system F family protein [Anaerolineaceae bacterium]|jgi:tight adherence protein B
MSLITILLIGGGLELVLLAIGLISTISSQRSVAEERISQLTAVDREVLSQARKRPTPLTDWLNNRVQGSSYGNRIARDLARADLKMKPAEYIVVICLSVIGIGMVGYFIGSRSLVLGIAGAIFGIFVPGMYVRSRQARRLQKFNDQLPDMLNLVVNGLRAGYSTMQAMESVSKEMPSPICDEFRRVVQEMQLGISMEAALDNLLRRIPSDDLDLVITAINVQREVGGNLAEILDTISHTIRERIRIKGEIRVLTTQTMYSGRMLALMPVAVILVLYLLNREYMMEFFKPESGICGFIALGLAAILIISGYFAMNKLAQIEV